MKAPRIILADAHLMGLDAIKNFLEKEFDVVGTFTDGNTLVKCAPALTPDVIVLDISLPLMNGLIAGERLKQVLPKVKLVYLTMNLEPHTAREAFRLGASGYVAKNSAATELIKALRLALVGRSYISDLIVKDELPSIFIQRAKRLKRASPLTMRQEEVLQLLAEGRSMKEAAASPSLKVFPLVSLLRPQVKMLPAMKPESLLMWRQPAEDSKIDISVMTREVRIGMMDHDMFPMPYVRTGANQIHRHRHYSVDPGVV